jgi:hypothetical protein
MGSKINKQSNHDTTPINSTNNSPNQGKSNKITIALNIPSTATPTSNFALNV